MECPHYLQRLAPMVRPSDPLSHHFNPLLASSSFTFVISIPVQKAFLDDRLRALLHCSPVRRSQKVFCFFYRSPFCFSLSAAEYLR